MRRKAVAGNWKMNKNVDDSKKLINEILTGLKSVEHNCDVIICPPFTSLTEAHTLLKNSQVKLGAQNIYYETEGAFTGEISADMVKSSGCEYVIIGHSERRTIFKETDDEINKKIKAAISAGLIPIFCVGETLEERENDIMEEVIKRQVTEGLVKISEPDFKKIIIAYEPVWAIGTGKTASPRQAQEVHSYIRNLLRFLYSDEAASNTIIQYGGSVKPDNAESLLSQPDIDGALVGGACLKSSSFIDIIKAA